jgi:hypothetical protein
MKLLLSITILLTGCCLSAQPVAQQPTLKYWGYDSTKAIAWQNIIPASSKLIISAEVHEVSVNTDYFFHLFEYLSKGGYRNIILEAPYSTGFFCNEYLATGNDSLLNIFCRTEEAMCLWKKMYALNNTLPEGEKINVLAIDFELDAANRKDIFVSAVQYIVRNCEKKYGKEAPPSIAGPVAQLPLARSIGELRSLKNQLAAVINDLDAQLFLDSSQLVFELLVTRNDKFGAGRDKTMYNNFLQLYDLLPKEAKKAKFYAQFGWGHVRKTNDGCLGMLFQTEENSPLRNHTFFIGTQYINCYSSLPDNNHYKNENSGVINDNRLVKQLETICSVNAQPVKYIDDATENWRKESDALMVFCNFNGTAFLKR